MHDLTDDVALMRPVIDALRASGSTTKPKPVPETPFWVITNTNTSRKQNMVAQLMNSMGYDEELTARVCGAV
jgi:negative modulator of initiation of replication